MEEPPLQGDAICPHCDGAAYFTFEGWGKCDDCGTILNEEEMSPVQDTDYFNFRQAKNHGKTLLELGEIEEEEYHQVLDSYNYEESQDDPDLIDNDIEGYD